MASYGVSKDCVASYGVSKDCVASYGVMPSIWLHAMGMRATRAIAVLISACMLPFMQQQWAGVSLQRPSECSDRASGHTA